MSEAQPLTNRDGASSGPTVSFGFNLGKIADHGEDSDPIVRDGPDLALLAVFDGMGGAGGTVYETEDGPRSGAYLASRIARDVVEERMLELLVPDWNLNGEAAAEDLRRALQGALVRRLAELKAPPSRLRSKLLRGLPTTMTVLALQRANRTGSTWLCHVFWAGDSRGYVFQPDGAHQLTVDDLRDANDAMANLRSDSVVSNAVSADTEFHINYRRVQLRAPFFLLCATDGCFGYLPSPMHFERLVLRPLTEARTRDAWSRAIQTEVAAVTGDDAAMSVVSVGAGMKELHRLYAPRLAELEDQFTAPIDDLTRSVQRAEDELTAQRQRQLDQTQALWARYQPGYERHLRTVEAAPDEAESDDPELISADGDDRDQAGRVDGHADGRS
ncbi:MAG: protein phosphatase 2C domain-containing protein, partial [Actinomycetota bacterium]|nr:protein phosphatase 2C domain-containing protein [Actinomycetota bacterium]